MRKTTETAAPQATKHPGAAQGPRSSDELGQAKVLPPRSPVDVPRLPPKPAAARGARTENGAVEDASTESSWADNTRPAPAKKNVRNSNIF